MEEAGRGGRTDARNSELAAGAEKAAVKAAEKIAREASADGKLDNTEKSEAKKAAEKAAKDKVKEAENANAGTGEVVVQQGDTVWGALRNAGYSDADIVSKGLVNQVAQASGLQNADQIRPGDVLKIPSNGNSTNGEGRQLTQEEIQAQPELREALRQAAVDRGLPADAVPGVNSSAKSEFVEGANDMRQGELTLRDPNTGEVLGTYQFNNGGFQKGSIPEGTYEVSFPRLRDKDGMVVDGFGFSFDLTQQGMADGTANDPRYSSPRVDLRIHPDGNNPGTAGCIGIIGGADVQRQFYEQASQLVESGGGSFLLEFN